MVFFKGYEVKAIFFFEALDWTDTNPIQSETKPFWLIPQSLVLSLKCNLKTFVSLENLQQSTSENRTLVFKRKIPLLKKKKNLKDMKN